MNISAFTTPAFHDRHFCWVESWCHGYTDMNFKRGWHVKLGPVRFFWQSDCLGFSFAEQYWTRLYF